MDHLLEHLYETPLPRASNQHQSFLPSNFETDSFCILYNLFDIFLLKGYIQKIGYTLHNSAFILK